MAFIVTEQEELYRSFWGRWGWCNFCFSVGLDTPASSSWTNLPWRPHQWYQLLVFEKGIVSVYDTYVMSVGVCVCVCVCYYLCLEFQDSFWELVLSSDMGPGDWTHIVRLLYHPNHLVDLSYLSCCFGKINTWQKSLREERFILSYGSRECCLY